MRHNNLVRQFVLMTVSSLVVVLILVKADIMGRLAYSVERGRIRALRESLPSEAELHTRFEADRATVAAVLPAVVSISTEREYSRSDFEGLDPQFHRFFFPEDVQERDDAPTATNGAPIPEQGEPAGTNGPPTTDDEPSITLPSGQGSGFVIDAARGYIVTNSHVLARATSISVRLADGRRADAHVLGTDPKTDLAVLKIDAGRLHELAWGDSLATQVGDGVFAVGNPFGLEGTVSRGIISAKNRSNVGLPNIEYQGFLQTDAVINPGNSGGPLVNMRGEVVGVNVAIATRSGNYDGIGFAIPAHRAARLIPELVRGGTIARGYLGVYMPATVRLAEQLKAELGWTEPSGVPVTEIVPDSPASRSGLRPNDIIVEYQGQTVASNADIGQAVADTMPETIVTMKVWRRGAFVTLEVEIGRQAQDFTTRVRRPSPSQE